MIFFEKQTLVELCLKAQKRYRKKTCFQTYRDGGVYNRLSYNEFGSRVISFALLLKRLGIEKGDRVMIMAENRPEWPIAWFGTALAGGITVPVLTDFSREQTEFIAKHAEISAIYFTEKTAPKISGIDPAINRIQIDLDRDHDPGTQVYNSEEFPEVEEDDPASIIYTSGTTGSSKGVVLSHKNLVYTAVSSRNVMKIFSRDRLLSVIPLAHTYECSLGMLAPVIGGASVTYLDKPPSPAILLPAMQTLRPTAIITVPLFIEKICKQVIFPKLEKNPLYKFKPTRRLAILMAGTKLLSALGSSIRFFGIGGAPLSADVETFLKKASFPYSIGYGLTETSPLLSASLPYKFPIRSVGKILKGTNIRISSEGEIQMQGPQLMLGYYRDEERNREAFTSDGWFRTGDLGRIDKKGNIFIYGRLKALILGPSGENIYPEEIEGLLNTSALVEDALVVAGERGELVAFVVLNEKAQTMIAALGDNLEELKNMVNKKLAGFSRLHRIEVKTEPFEKTATKKIKRFLYSV